ncbi:uncharacterized protein [Watersipora subatra]|uniref:uncharacterized protein n=1 Tax=Watersipora subatra TaxID=2589382 RepID=UPI00355AF33B
MKKFTSSRYSDCTTRTGDLTIPEGRRQVGAEQLNIRSNETRSRSKERRSPVKIKTSYLLPNPSEFVACARPKSSRLVSGTPSYLPIVLLAPSQGRSSSVSPNRMRRHNYERIEEIHPSGRVSSRRASTSRKEMDSSKSCARYGLFGPNVAPFWEYYTTIPGLTNITPDIPTWRVSELQKKNCQVVHLYMKKEEEIRKRKEFERIEQERRACVPEWMREISERRREKRLVSTVTSSNQQKGEQLNKPELPPWQKELVMKRRTRQQSGKN